MLWAIDLQTYRWTQRIIENSFTFKVSHLKGLREYFFAASLRNYKIHIIGPIIEDFENCTLKI